VLRLSCLALALAVSVAHPGLAAPQAPTPEDELSTLLGRLGFGQNDLQDLLHGKVISRGLDTEAAGEIAIAGAVRVEVPREYFLARIRDIADFKRDNAVLELGVFSDPPQLADLDPLTLSDDDLHALRRCRPGHCDLKLSAEAMSRLDGSVEWRAPDASETATRVFKSMLLDRTRAFLAGGLSALPPYADGSSHSFEDAMHGILDESADLLREAPEYLQAVEGAPPAGGLETIVYWSKEKAAFKPLISLTQMSFYTEPVGSSTITYTLSINFYASHYLDGSLGSAIAVQRAADGGHAVYLIYVNRSRVDALHGLFSGLRRWGVQREARGGLRERLESTRRRLERSYASLARP
jgi:hypothetical protein